MALVNTRDMARTRSDLERWLATKMPAASDVRIGDITTSGTSGFSNETLFFRADWTDDGQAMSREMVARFGPRGPKLFPEYDLEQQFRIMKTLAERTPVPMPPMLWSDDADGILGEEFYVMGRVEGKVPADDPIYLAEGWVIDLKPTQRERLYVAGLDALAAVHDVDWADCGLADLARPELGATPLTQLIQYFEDYFVWARRDDLEYPVVEAAFEWIRANRPDDTDDEVVLNWGDARPGNLIIAEDQSVAAVVDWELAFLGSRELDLGWWMFTQRAFSEGYGLPLPEGILGTEETARKYAEITGYQPQNLEFHERFAGLRSALCFVRFCTVMIEEGAMPLNSPIVHANPISQMLAHVMGMPSSVGEANRLELSQPGS